MEVDSSNSRHEDLSKSSMSVPEVNNLIVSLRSTVKLARHQVIQKLIRKGKLYRNKKGTEEQMKANGKKAERLLDEVKILKRLDIDKVSKYSLGNTLSIEQAAAKGNMNERVYTRIACHKLVHDKIMKWRSEHFDWESLAAFALSKSTGRRFKKKQKTNQKEDEADDSTNVEVAKLREFVHCVTGIVENDDSMKEVVTYPGEMNGDVTLSTPAELPLTKTAADATAAGENEVMKKLVRDTLQSIVTENKSNEAFIDGKINIESKSANKRNVKNDVVVKQITLDQLSDEELFIPSLEMCESEDNSRLVSTESDVENKDDFFITADGDSEDENVAQDLDSDVDEEREVSLVKRVASRATFAKQQRSSKHNISGSKSFIHCSRRFGSDRSKRFSVEDFCKNHDDMYSKKLRDKVQSKSEVNQQDKGRFWKHQTRSADRAKSTPDSFRCGYSRKETQKSRSKPANKSLADGLHPSWEASRQRKEQQKRLLEFRGSRIVFTDDD